MLRTLMAASVRRALVRGSAAAALAGGLLVVSAPAAHAASQLVCTGGGQVIIHGQSDGTYLWALSGIGSCTTPEKIAQVRQVNLVGTGTTTGLGLCSGGTPDLSALALHMDVTFVSLSATRELISTVQHQIWSLPATTFPIATGFAVSDPGGPTIGGGEFETHIFAQCPPDGQPTMQVNWVQTA
jgi:hypothetical protein